VTPVTLYANLIT